MNKLTMKMRLFAAFLLLGLWGATAQTAREQIAAMPERAGGIYHSYEYLPGPAVPAPKGYVPFYISHYGRHGSRWHTSEKIYAEPLGILRKADSAGVLTPKGRDLLAKVEVIAADARDRYGDLSPRGVAEHRGIAERMYKAYPEVFSTEDGRECFVPVSYTHLDVYKRQGRPCAIGVSGVLYECSPTNAPAATGTNPRPATNEASSATAVSNERLP